MSEIPELGYGAIIEYDGTDFLGYQLQAHGRTVQGEIERALQEISQSPVRIKGAGRTDAGVHATGQVIAFELAWRHSLAALQRACNAKLPPDIVVKTLKIVDKRFHPRYSALSRSYRYTVVNQPWPAALEQRYAYHLSQPLDLTAMNQAGLSLLGSHDFASFGKAPQGEVTTRLLTQASWSAAGHQLYFEITANAFLYRMVRRIVASLIKVGLGQWSVADIQEILRARDLTRSAAPVPAHGLCLVQVTYPAGVWDDNDEFVS